MSKVPYPINEKLLLEQAGFIRALSRSLVQAEGLAEDLGQEAYLAALEHPPKQQSALRSWLRRVLHNKVHTEHRSKSRREHCEREAVRSSDAPRPESSTRTVRRDHSSSLLPGPSSRAHCQTGRATRGHREVQTSACPAASEGSPG